ncbi:hypothetical protein YASMINEVIRUS_450 [Yasminevirus sp. GU-2018]|uniref:Uncharacterized protein n=1 Tax=Yasminevirus sp. GU-2018 TaxID=2420051 RepID=A0A5K0U822_9VIRU|nr:hypothetical protein YASMINEVIRUS_450 [Yasminevirus sp. GU-2018]
MTKYKNIKSLTNDVVNKDYDNMRICYYPHGTFIDDPITHIEGIDDEDAKKITTKIKYDSRIKGRYVECGMRDTFVRVTDVDNDTGSQKHRSFFRRSSYKLRVADIDGFFVLDIFTACDEEDLPVLADYPHYIQCDVDTYVVSNRGDPLKVCFTTTSDKHTTDNNKQNSKVCLNIARDMTDDQCDANSLEKFIIKFFKDVKSLKNDVGF